MNPLRRLSVTFGSILLLGGLVFIYQTRRLAEIRQPVESRSTAASKAAVPPLGEPVATDSPAIASSQPDTDDAGRFIAKLKAALAAALTEKQLTAFMITGGKLGTFEALASAVNLTREESATIREGLQKYDGERAALYLNHDLTPAALTGALAEVKRREDEWLAAQLGTERYASLLRYNDQRSSTSAKQRAAESVARIGSATDLSEEQREKLYEGFLELNLRPTPPQENKIVVETTGKLEIGPGPPDLSGEVEKILTPEQWEHYQLQTEASTANTGDQTKAMMEMMESLLPAVIELLENDP